MVQTSQNVSKPFKLNYKGSSKPPQLEGPQHIYNNCALERKMCFLVATWRISGRAGVHQHFCSNGFLEATCQLLTKLLMASVVSQYDPASVILLL